MFILTCFFFAALSFLFTEVAASDAQRAEHVDGITQATDFPDTPVRNDSIGTKTKKAKKSKEKKDSVGVHHTKSHSKAGKSA